MPDSYTNVGPGAPAGDPRTGVPFQAAPLYDGEPALAATKPMEMSAPIEPVIPTSNPGEIVHEEELPIQGKPRVATALPLKDNVSPFAQPEPRIPATEYVRVTALEPVAHVPPPPPPQPVAKPAATPAEQAIGPIIRKHPAPEPAVPKPPAPAAVLQPSSQQPQSQSQLQPASSPAPAPAKKITASPPAPVPVPAAPIPPPPPASQKELPPEPVSLPEPPKHGPALSPLPEDLPVPAPSSPPIPVSAAPVAMPLSEALQDTDLFAPPAAEMQAVLSASSVATVPAVSHYSSSTPAMLYSHNTRVVWHARRAGKILNIVAIIGVLIILGGIFAYWVSIGSPTKVEDLPFINSK